MGSPEPDEPQSPGGVSSSSSSTGSDRDYEVEQDESREAEDDEDEKSSEGQEPEIQERSKITCHSCRRPTVLDCVSCSRCIFKFCGGCMRNRFGEDVKVESEKNVRWVCPRCRGGCGEGCRICCTCGPCRRLHSLPSAGITARVARGEGFSNVHDYLIHKVTGESASQIERRKDGRGWTKATGALVLAWAQKKKRSSRRRPVKIGCIPEKGKDRAESNNETRKQSTRCERAESSNRDGVNVSLSSRGSPRALGGMQSNDFRRGLERLWDRPFSSVQLTRMNEHIISVGPAQLDASGKARQYAECHPVLCRKLIRETTMKGKLKLLRGFFFWLQSATMDGAYRPWMMDHSEQEEEEIEDYRSRISAPSLRGVGRSFQNWILPASLLVSGFLTSSLNEDWLSQLCSCCNSKLKGLCPTCGRGSPFVYFLIFTIKGREQTTLQV